MNKESFESNPLRESDEEFQELRLRLSRLPQHPVPAELLHKLKQTYIGNPWADTIRAWFSWPSLWKSLGALTLAALLAGFWVSRSKNSEEGFIDARPLLAAHSRYQEEALVPQGDMAGSNFGAQLAVYYGEEN